MKPQHLSDDVRSFSKGALPDIQQELLGASEEGVYYDSNNFRLSENGWEGTPKKIGGEILKYAGVDNGCGGTGLALDSGYQCILSEVINNHIVEIWAHATDPITFPSLIIIDGNVCLKSSLFPVRVGHPLQWDKNDNCPGGELYFTDYFNLPFFFNIQDLITNRTANPCSKYFSAFNPALYTFGIQSPLDHPILDPITPIVNAGAGGGQPAGEYLYAIQYVSPAGDQTNTSVYTNPIPIPLFYGNNTSFFPFQKTAGGVANVAVNTSFAPRIKFRVNNYLNFQYVQIVRKRYNNNIALGTLPVTEIIKKIAIEPGEISIRTFEDIIANEDVPIVVNDDTASLMASIARAKAIRYFNERIHLMNVVYNSADIESSVIFKTSPYGKYIYPYVEKMSSGGHSDPWNVCNKRKYPSGERFGFSAVGFDGFGNSTFAKAVPEGTNFQFPNRRENIASFPDSAYLSNNSSNGGVGTGTVRAGTVDGNIGQTFEVFDLANGIRKASSATTIHIDADAGNTSPLYPTAPSDTNVSGYAVQINTGVNTKQSLFDNGTHYNADQFGKVFDVTYYTQGIAIPGLESWPDDIKAFSILRTKPAGRVVMQGMGVYTIQNKTTNDKSNFKNTDQIRFFSPDLDNGIASSDFLTNFSQYNMQAVSPLGFYTEVYSGYNVLGLQGYAIDMINYARIIRDNGNMNAGDTVINSGLNDGGSGYWCTMFGMWRDNTLPPGSFVFPNAGNGNAIFGFSTTPLNAVTGSSRQTNLYDLSLSVEIYQSHQIASGENDFNNSNTRKFHEPYYVCNIIQDGKNVADQTIDQYVETGHYQKIESLIGLSDGNNNQSLGYDLVDERFDDCIPNILDAQVASGVSTYGKAHTYIYVDDGLTKNAWLNVTYLNAGYVALLKINIDANGSVTDANGVAIYGMYAHTVSTNGRLYTIQFTVLNSLGILYAPQTGTKILVIYDNRFPLKVFGGDTIVGESVFAVQDNQTDNDGNFDTDNTFGWRTPFPYPEYDINDNISQVQQVNPVILETDNGVKVVRNTGRSALRQWLVMWTAEQKSNLAYSYGVDSTDSALADTQQFFPNVNYIYRPLTWDSNDVFDGLATDYHTIYPHEDAAFGFGGFRFRPQNNIDYSHAENNRVYSSKPAVGFTDQTMFCARDIYSLPRPMNIQDSPNLKTFPPLNFYDLEDSNGEIKFAWDALSSRDNNLYAITNTGVCMLVTDKRILSEISGDQLAIIGTDSNQVILGQYWISKSIGMWGQSWQTWGTYDNKLFWMNNEGAYKLFDNGITLISSDSNSVLQPYLLLIRNDYTQKMCGTYDAQHDEYWGQLEASDVRPRPDSTFVYEDSGKRKSYIGKYTYLYDKYLYFAQKMYGFRNANAYELNEGATLSGDNITAKMRLVTGKEQIFSKEFTRMRIASTAVPTSVSGYNNTTDSVAIWTISQFRNFGAFEAYIPRKANAPFGRVQGRSTVIEIVHNAASDFALVDINIGYKKL